MLAITKDIAEWLINNWNASVPWHSGTPDAWTQAEVWRCYLFSSSFVHASRRLTNPSILFPFSLNTATQNEHVPDKCFPLLIIPDSLSTPVTCCGLIHLGFGRAVGHGRWRCILCSDFQYILSFGTFRHSFKHHSKRFRRPPRPATLFWPINEYPQTPHIPVVRMASKATSQSEPIMPPRNGIRKANISENHLYPITNPRVLLHSKVSRQVWCSWIQLTFWYYFARDNNDTGLLRK